MFVRFSLFLISNYSKKLIHLALNGFKVQNFGGSD